MKGNRRSDNGGKKKPGQTIYKVGQIEQCERQELKKRRFKSNNKMANWYFQGMNTYGTHFILLPLKVNVGDAK